MIDCRDNNVENKYKQYGKILLHSHSWKTEKYLLKGLSSSMLPGGYRHSLTDLCHAQCIQKRKVPDYSTHSAPFLRLQATTTHSLLLLSRVISPYLLTENLVNTKETPYHSTPLTKIQHNHDDSPDRLSSTTRPGCGVDAWLGPLLRPCDSWVRSPMSL